MSDELVKAMADLDEEKVLQLVGKAISNGMTQLQIVELCRKGVEIVGQKYGAGEYYLADLIMSEEIFRGVMRLVEPLITANDEPTKGPPIVMGTIEGDIHDLGKNIVIYLLRSYGFQVRDLGVDVPPEEFVRAVSKTGARILGISVLLSFCVGSIKKVVDLLREAGLRDKVKVVVGGYPVNQLVKEYTGADYYANDVTKFLDIYREILAEGSDESYET